MHALGYANSAVLVFPFPTELYDMETLYQLKSVSFPGDGKHFITLMGEETGV